MPLLLRFPFITYLEHAPSFGDNGSSYMLNTPPHLAIPIFRYLIHLKHDPPRLAIGDSGSSYMLNVPLI